MALTQIIRKPTGNDLLDGLVNTADRIAETVSFVFNGVAATGSMAFALMHLSGFPRGGQTSVSMPKEWVMKPRTRA
ncbi:hypothetical protein ABTL92_19895, partial [Acinetobacter baumannii]